MAGVDFREIERTLVEAALRRTGGNQVRAAALLHMTRDQIRHRMSKFDVATVGREPEVEPPRGAD